jgi:hypothetical protein
MALIVRLEGEMPPLVLPPYSMDGDTTVREAFEAACRYFKRDASESQMVAQESGAVLDDLDAKLSAYGVGHWSVLTLRPTVDKEYRRVTFGA